MRVAIDIDDTIALFSVAFTKFLRKEYNISLRKDQITAFHAEKVLGITQKQLYTLFLQMEKMGIIAKLETITNAVHYINKLYDEGHEIIILTSRIFDNETTLKWLADNNIKYHKFYRRFKDKTSINFDILIDDDPYHIFACEEKRIYSILMSQPWNYSLKVRKMKFCRRAKGWHQIYRIVRGIEVGKRGF